MRLGENKCVIVQNDEFLHDPAHATFKKDVMIASCCTSIVLENVVLDEPEP